MVDELTSADLPRVLVLSDLYPSLGHPQGGSFVLERVNALRSRGVQVQLLALRPRPSVALRTLLRASGRSLGKPIGSPFDDATFRLGVADYVKTSRWAPTRKHARRIADAVIAQAQSPVDVIHAHGMYRAKAGIIAHEVSQRTGVPYVVTLHGSDVNVNMRRDPARFVEALSSAAAVIYVSQALRDAAIALGAPAGNAHVIPNGVDTDLFTPGPKDDTSPIVSFVGGLAPVKGADRLPQIFHEVASEVAAARFEVVGAGALKAQLEEETKDLDVTFHGHVDRERVAEVMARTSVIVVPSRSEGWGCVVLEAQSAGAVAVATRVGGLIESVGDERFLAPDSEGVEGLAPRIVMALDEPRSGLRARAETFSWGRLALQEVRLYQAVVGARG
ncbi:glycosyltransferase [Janibacter sp. YB324]|uniref:glycosyltransferase n=1 Tax=Janibacter sp. YB324 TaxID=2761047 RepID=UPI0016299930|nr:glycosyltransferase [Janibacter sp. YB324]QNF94951.1 glycosyltransferase [Janibacter sp. YB324]